MRGTELDEANTVRIWKTQLTVLEDQAAKAEVAEAQRARLEVELDQAKSAVQRVDSLEQDKKRLRQQLEVLLQKQRLSPNELDNPTRAPPSVPMLSPAIGPLVATPNEERKVNTKTVPGEVYNTLARKYNDLAENWKHEKKKKEQHITKYEKSKEILAGWQALAERRMRQVEQRDAIIESLKRGVPQDRNRALDEVTQDIVEGSDSLITMDKAAGRKAWPHIPLSSSLAHDHGKPSNRSSALPMLSHEAAPQHPLPSLSTTTTMDIPSDPPEVPVIICQQEQVPQVTNNYATIQDSDEDNDPDSPLLLPVLPPSTETQPLLDAHSSSTTDEEALAKLDAVFDKDVSGETKQVVEPDSPEIVSIRRVKRSRNREDTQSKTPRKKIKVEITSSPTGTARLVNSSDSLDLDDIGQKTDTPRKEKHLRDLARGRRALSDDTDSPRTDSQRRELSRLRAVSEQIADETPTRHALVGRKNSALQPKSVNEQIFPRHGSLASAKKLRATNDRDIGNLIEGGEIPAAITKANSNTLVTDGKLQHLLEKTSPAKVVLSPARTKTPAHPSKASSERLAVFKDDSRRGGARNFESPMGDQRTPNALGQDNRTHLNSLTTPRTVTQDSDTPGITLTKRPTTWDMPPTSRKAKSDIGKPTTPASDTRSPALSNNVPKTDMCSTRKAAQRPPRKAQTEAEWQHDPDQEPLRLRPVASLRLDDFKVNPNYNQGYNYAFREVVRDKDSRQELQGCLKPGCCLEKFRAMAIAERNPNIPPTPAQQEADEELLEDYLGDNVYKLRHMTQAEKNDILLQARIRKISNQHGKHRHAYERPSTPPGFWRADFPTTQEEAADRAQASQDYKVQVRQRYEEAMRGNGRYVFRDE